MAKKSCSKTVNTYRSANHLAGTEYMAALAAEWAQVVPILSSDEWYEILSPVPELHNADRTWYPIIIQAALARYEVELVLGEARWRPDLKSHREQFHRLYRAAFEMR